MDSLNYISFLFLVFLLVWEPRRLHHHVLASIDTGDTANNTFKGSPSPIKAALKNNDTTDEKNTDLSSTPPQAPYGGLHTQGLNLSNSTKGNSSEPSTIVDTSFSSSTPPPNSSDTFPGHLHPPNPVTANPPSNLSFTPPPNSPNPPPNSSNTLTPLPAIPSAAFGTPPNSSGTLTPLPAIPSSALNPPPNSTLEPKPPSPSPDSVGTKTELVDKAPPKGDVSEQSHEDAIVPTDSGGSKEITFEQQCSENSCPDQIHLKACLVEPKNETQKMVIILFNSGQDALSVNISWGSILKDIMLLTNQTREVELARDPQKQSSISVGAEDRICILRTSPHITMDDLGLISFYKDYLVPTYGAYVLLPALLLTAAVVFACCKLSRKKRHGGGANYRELEMGHHRSNDLESAAVGHAIDSDGWDQNWTDGWEEDEQDAKHTVKTKNNNVKPNASEDDGWDDNWDD